jgi:hypothetical protein
VLLGMDTTRTGRPCASSSCCAAIASATSEPVAMITRARPRGRQHVAAAHDGRTLRGVAWLGRQVLARQQQRAWAVAAVAARGPGRGGLGASQGRQTSSPGIRRRLAACSTGWCVGPSSPRPMLSCVNTCTTRCFISAAMRMALRL